MGLVKDIGELAGKVAGVAISVPIAAVGEITNSDFIREIADGTYNATAHTGKLVGEITEGTVKCATGVIQQDSKKVEEGFCEVIETSAKTVVGVGKGFAKTIGSGIDTVSAIAEGDKVKAIKTGKEMLKVAAVSTFAIGICDMIDGIDVDNDGGIDFFEDNEVDDVYVSSVDNLNGGTGLNFVYEGEPPTYWVNAPHTKNGGYPRTMPDASVSNNLSS